MRTLGVRPNVLKRVAKLDHQNDLKIKGQPLWPLRQSREAAVHE